MIQSTLIILFKAIIFWTIKAEYCKNFNKLLIFKATLKMNYIQVQKKNQYFIYNLSLVFELQILVLELLKRSWVLQVFTSKLISFYFFFTFSSFFFFFFSQNAPFGKYRANNQIITWRKKKFCLYVCSLVKLLLIFHSLLNNFIKGMRKQKKRKRSDKID